MATYLITGSSRGLGLAFVKQLLTYPPTAVSKIFGTARGPAPELEQLAQESNGRVTVVKMEVSDEESVKKAAAEVKSELNGKGLDVLINNAGICEYAQGGVASMDNLLSSITVNVLGAHHVTRAFLPLLQKGSLKKVVNISTTLASITHARAASYFPAPAYKISKAALNALTVQYALEYEKEGFTFMALAPGWLQTSLGGGSIADLTAEQGATASLEIIHRTDGAALNGQFPKVFVDGWQHAKGPNVYDGGNVEW